MIVKLLKDPLLHFLALGALLFAGALVRDVGDEDPERIVIDAVTVERIAEAARRLHGREPTRDELRELLEPAIRDEVLYRQALALGLDEDDDEVRRRLIEKMQYLTMDLADPEPPSEDVLREHFAANIERFELPAAVTFEQVFFSPRLHGESLEASVEAGLRALREGTPPAEVGDRTPLRPRYDDADRARIEVIFGPEMTDALFAAAPGSWDGPYLSDFGVHLAKVVEHRPARRRSFDEARDEVLAAYAAARRAERNEAEYARIRARYDVVVEWPDVADAARRADDGAGR